MGGFERGVYTYLRNNFNDTLIIYEWLAKGAGGKSGAGFFDKLGLGN